MSSGLQFCSTAGGDSGGECRPHLTAHLMTLVDLSPDLPPAAAGAEHGNATQRQWMRQSCFSRTRRLPLPGGSRFTSPRYASIAAALAASTLPTPLGSATLSVNIARLCSFFALYRVISHHRHHHVLRRVKRHKLAVKHRQRRSRCALERRKSVPRPGHRVPIAYLRGFDPLYPMARSAWERRVEAFGRLLEGGVRGGEGRRCYSPWAVNGGRSWS